MTKRKDRVPNTAPPKRSRMDTDPLAIEVGARIRAVRLERGLTGAELSRRLGVPSTALTAWERGRVVPSVRTLLSLASALGVAPAELLGAEIVDVALLAERIGRLSPTALAELARFVDLLERAQRR